MPIRSLRNYPIGSDHEAYPVTAEEGREILEGVMLDSGEIFRCVECGHVYLDAFEDRDWEGKGKRCLGCKREDQS